MARGGAWAGAVFVGAAIGAVAATAIFVSTHHETVHSGLCTVTVGEDAYSRTAEAANNAALVAAVANRRGMGTFASTIGVATAIQESGLRNLDYGDRDSLGLFQQRPSQGWGTEDEVQDPHFATVSFYKHLSKVDGWQDMRVTDAAQAVQRSGFPEAYEDHAAEGAAWAAAFRGEEPFAAVSCDLDAVSEPGNVSEFAQRIQDDYGQDVYTVSVLGRNERAVLLGVTATSGAQQDLDAIANWAVAVADDQGLASVRLGDEQWLREQGIVEPTATPGYDGVLIGLVENVPAD